MSRLAVAAVFSVLLFLVVEFQFLDIGKSSVVVLVQSSKGANHDTPKSKEANHLTVNTAQQGSEQAHHLDVNTPPQSTADTPQSSKEANHLDVGTAPHSSKDTPQSKEANVELNSPLHISEDTDTPQSSKEANHLEVNSPPQTSQAANQLAPDRTQDKAPWVEVMPPWARSPYRGSLTVTDAVPKQFKGQFGEDQFLYDNFFFRQGNGTYIEMGALDGTRFSNTFAFDKDLGWKGILIEGDPGNFKHLPKNRPGQIAVNAAVCQQRQEVHYVQTGEGAVRGIFEFMAPQFKEKWHRKFNIAKEQAISCVPMVEILSRYGISHFNLWSLDVEGAEFEILKSMDFSRFTFDVMIIEARPSSTEKNKQVWDLINKTGLFNFHSHYKDNDVWVAKTFTPHKKPAKK